MYKLALTLDTVLGSFPHSVLGGRWLATKISIKTVTLTGSILFIIFGVVYFLEAWFDTELDIRETLEKITGHD